jgi:hypothetical protein
MKLLKDYANEEHWQGLWSSLNRIEAQFDADDDLEDALNQALDYLDPHHRQHVERELDSGERSLLTDELCLRVFLFVLRTRGIPVDNGTTKIKSTLPPPSLKIPFEIADRLSKNDEGAICEVEEY